MKKKRIMAIAAVLCMAFGLGALSSCGVKDDGKINVVVTIFPEYDWVMNVVGEKSDKFSVTWLLNGVTDLHSYDPSVSELVKVYNADIFIYVGGESDGWAKETLASGNVKKDMRILNLMDILGSDVKEEEIKEGMQADDGEDKEYDEHVWLSLKNAAIFVDKIAEAICSVDSENSGEYLRNAKDYKEKLSAVDSEYRAAVSGATKNALVFADRFPFRYMTDDYSLDYYAAFVGCSAESAAKPETITFLASKVDELGLNVILTIERSDGRIAQTVKASTTAKNQAILAMNSMQSITEREYKDGINYLSVIRSNLEVLKRALA